MKLRKETLREIAKYFIDISKFIVAGAIIEKVFNRPDSSLMYACIFAGIFCLMGFIVINATTEKRTYLTGR